jgi:hypothetical protein
MLKLNNLGTCSPLLLDLVGCVVHPSGLGEPASHLVQIAEARFEAGMERCLYLQKNKSTLKLNLICVYSADQFNG